MICKFTEYLNESPDSIFNSSLEPISFIIFKDVNQLLQQFDGWLWNDIRKEEFHYYFDYEKDEFREHFLETLKKLKIKGKDIVIYNDTRGNVWVNKYNTKLRGDNDYLTHYQLLVLILSDMVKDEEKKDLIIDMGAPPNGRLFGYTSGRLTLTHGKKDNYQLPLVSFWTYTDNPSNYMRVLTKNTSIKFPNEINIEMAPKGSTAGSNYGDGNISTYSVNKKKAPKGKTEPNEPKEIKSLSMSDAFLQRRFPGAVFEKFDELYNKITNG